MRRVLIVLLAFGAVSGFCGGVFSVARTAVHGGPCAAHHPAP